MAKKINVHYFISVCVLLSFRSMFERLFDQ